MYKKFFSNLYVLWSFISMVIFLIILVGHFVMYNSIPISSILREPSIFFSFYFIRLVISYYIAYVILVIFRKIKFIFNKYIFLFFVLSVLILISQNILFIIYLDNVFDSILTISIYSWIAKFVICATISSSIFIVRNKWLILLCLLCCGLWICAEIINYRAFGFFLDGLSITLVGYLNGFLSSILLYIKWYDFIILLLPLLLVPFIMKFEGKMRCIQLHTFLLMIGIIVIFNTISCYGLTNEHFSETHHPAPDFKNMEFNSISVDAIGMMSGADRNDYIDKLSVLHSFFFSIKEFLDYEFNSTKISITEEENNIISQFIQPKIKVQPPSKLIIILIESLEEWVVRDDVMPNLCNFININNSNILYAHNVVSQRKAGSSADGQFIINTGILPVNTGTVSFNYCYNKYPSLSELYSSSCGIFPHSLSVWNQKQMSDAYGIDSNYVVSEYDKEIFDTVVKKSNIHDYVLAITLSSHAPFDIWSDSSRIELPNNMPKLMSNYIKSINFMDKGLSILLNAVNTDSLLANSTIVITGDHSIFNNEQLNEFNNFINNEKLEYNLDSHNCPLIIYSPKIFNRVDINKRVYQMDIYTTILDLLGANSYYWKGFGLNLLASDTLRLISVTDADLLSDKMIKTNYFENYCKNE